MKYNINWLKSTIQAEERIKYLFFWGHHPRKDGQMSGSCLSQWWQGEFEVDEIIYPTAEHWMMAEKANLFEDQEMWERIIKCESPAEAKKLGRQVRGFDQKLWEAHRYEIVKVGNKYKFSQNAELLDFLLKTENRILVEASPWDRIWGIGMSKDHEKANHPSQWRGLNLLGFALMEVREELAD